MSEHTVRYEYITVNGAELFTLILTPEKCGRFPTVIMRSPYVDTYENMTEEEVCGAYLASMGNWLSNGYAVVYQHCRGRGKSTGDCIPSINEREDGLALLDFVRTCDFYNGELFLYGSSYTTSVHYVIAPYPDDIKGAIFGVQDSERYNITYRNGFLKKGLHGSWYVGMYKHKSHMKKNFSLRSFDILPLTDFSQTVFGESAADLDELMLSPDPKSPFWNTRCGGNEARGATDDVKFPVLFTTAFFDIYTGGIFDMWNSMSESAKSRSALVVSPYDHGDNSANSPIEYPNGRRKEAFGAYETAWFDAIRNNTKLPFETGKITYYSLFENVWKTDDFAPTGDHTVHTLGEGAVTYTYNPYDATEFRGGLSRAFGASAMMDAPNSRYDVVTCYTEPFEADTIVKGKMTAELTVSTDCEDTCFYIRIGIVKEDGTIALRDDIDSICRTHPDYIPGEKVKLSFECDELSFMVRQGEKLRIDIASANNTSYVRHTNNKGLYCEHATAKIAHNTVYLDESTLTLPIVK